VGENLVEIENIEATAVLRKGSESIIDLTPHHMLTEWLELPRINYKYNGKKYNYFYGIGSTDPNVNISVPEPNKVSNIQL